MIGLSGGFFGGGAPAGSNGGGAPGNARSNWWSEAGTFDPSTGPVIVPAFTAPANGLYQIDYDHVVKVVSVPGGTFTLVSIVHTDEFGNVYTESGGTQPADGVPDHSELHFGTLDYNMQLGSTIAFTYAGTQPCTVQYRFSVSRIQ